MHIGTIIVCVGSSTVPATGLFGWQYNASNGVIFVGVSAQILVFVYIELRHPFIYKILIKSMLPYALGIAKHLLIHTRHRYSHCYSHRHPNPRPLIGHLYYRLHS